MAGNHEAALWMKSRRKRLNMTQEGLAEKVHCDVETIRKYEAAKRTPQYDIAERLMIAFEIPPEHRDNMVAWFRNNQSPDWQPSITFDEPANSPSSLGVIGRGGDNQEQAEIDKENGMIIHVFAHRLRRSAKLIITLSGVLSLLVLLILNSSMFNTCVASILSSAAVGVNIAPKGEAIAWPAPQDACDVAENAIDGNPVRDGRCVEWVAEGTINRPWIQISFDAPKPINMVVLYDRINSNDHIIQGILDFSDGTKILVYDLPNNGVAKEIPLNNTRTITWVKFTVTEWEGSNIGLSEMEIYQSSN